MEERVMYLQGDLQTVFDALYNLGVIDPVLEMDWSETLEEMQTHQREFEHVVFLANSNNGNLEQLMTELETVDDRSLSYLAIEVAKEYADFHTREYIQ